MDSTSEGWKAIDSYPDYEVSTLGRVRSNRGGRPRALKLSASGCGYLTFGVSGPTGRKTLKVHREVAKAFLGKAPDGKPWVLHWDGDRWNNRLTNLRWGTASENVGDTRRHGRYRNGRAETTHCPYGHPYDESNTITNKRHYPNGRTGVVRRCKVCIGNKKGNK